MTLTNRGNTPLPLKAIAVTGPFKQTNTCPTELKVGQACTVTVVFAPTQDGNATGTLTFTTADGAEPAHVVTLAGEGVANAAPVIQEPSGLPLKGTVGKELTLKVDFTDADLADTHTARVFWGDGNPPVEVDVEQRAGGGTVTATKTFGAA
ncbi:choice-of-anchor D domain-containing protein, partial [Streptosporangium fragile]|uniref:choice-of-anchor D domain-containing protein n=1 Tax=Streptosporangium fragile TaxID=46186 RepID=UPI0031EA5539